MFDNQEKIAEGMKLLQIAVRRHAIASYLKLQAMQEAYLSRTNVAYTPEERKAIEYFLSAVIHKFHLASLSLEQLWAMSDDTRGGLVEAIELSLDRLEVSEDELPVISFAFDTFLFHARAFIDFSMLYICYFLRTGHEGSISQDRFKKELAKVTESDLSTKADKIGKYFNNSVFRPSEGPKFEIASWGTLLTDLRNKIAHRDIIRPSFESNETLLDNILLDWPTIKQTTYERFHQDMQTGMYSLLQEMAEILYEIDWIPGPYKEGMFNN